MKNNIIVFPKIKKTNNTEVSYQSSNDSLSKLREAFDKVREDWSLEPAELPENNKCFSSSKK